MFLKRNEFALACCVILHFIFVKTETSEVNTNEDIDIEEDEEQHDEHTFVALIDIVFTDGTKKTCTGTIIHDHVVITAAHCFCHESSVSIKPELTASFVVIGTKKMYESGYEQYLPIERILTHPKFRGWTADLSLVYTFAAMASDKPGKIIPLAGEKTSNPVDSNVTVFSWGHCKGNDVAHNSHISMTTQSPCSEETTEDFDEEPHRYTAGVKSKRSRGEERVLVAREQVAQQNPILRPQSRFQKETRQQTDLIHRLPLIQKLWNKELVDKSLENHMRKTPVKRLSRYLTYNDGIEEIVSQGHRIELETSTDMYHKITINHSAEAVPARATEEVLRKRDGASESTQGASLRAQSRFHGVQVRGVMGYARAVRRGRHVTRKRLKPKRFQKKIYRNWRRNMGTLQNKLTVETFGFINLAACKKVVEGSGLPLRYEINGDATCYSSDDHYITDEDSGAPAIRHGQLVAVTVGGARSDGDNVGVGMKISCYCTWITKNLPNGGVDINCCKNCCDAKNSEEKKNPQDRMKRV